MPPSPTIPSATVARFAHASAFKDLEPFADGYKSPPLGVDLGDVFISETIAGIGKNRRTVLSAMIVISQSCDLEHGKVGTVLMVEGTVQKRSDVRSASTEGRERILRLDIFHYRNSKDEVEDFIVEWDAQKLRAYEVDSFHETMRKQGYQRVARMRSVQALAMQQKFASQLTRVGMPDAMPIYRYGSLEVAVRAVKPGSWIPLIVLAKEDRAASVVGDDPSDLIIMDDALGRIRKALETADPAAFAQGAIEALRTELNDVVKLRRLRQTKLSKGKFIRGQVHFLDAPASPEEMAKIGAKVMMVINARSE